MALVNTGTQKHKRNRYREKVKRECKKRRSQREKRKEKDGEEETQHKGLFKQPFVKRTGREQEEEKVTLVARNYLVASGARIQIK